MARAAAAVELHPDLERRMISLRLLLLQLAACFRSRRWMASRSSPTSLALSPRFLSRYANKLVQSSGDILVDITYTTVCLNRSLWCPCSLSVLRVIPACSPSLQQTQSSWPHWYGAPSFALASSVATYVLFTHTDSYLLVALRARFSISNLC